MEGNQNIGFIPRFGVGDEDGYADDQGNTVTDVGGGYEADDDEDEAVPLQRSRPQLKLRLAKAPVAAPEPEPIESPVVIEEKKPEEELFHPRAPMKIVVQKIVPPIPAPPPKPALITRSTQVSCRCHCRSWL